MKALQRLNNPALAQYYAAAMQRLQREGMVSLDFPKQRRGAKVRFIQLVGTDTTGRQHILVTIDASSTGDISPDGTDLRRAALQAYINYGINPRPRSYENV